MSVSYSDWHDSVQIPLQLLFKHLKLEFEIYDVEEITFTFTLFTETSR